MSINVCNDRSMASITSLPSGVSGSSLVLISEQTASSSATIDFTSDIDSTYKEYQFRFTDIHPQTDGQNFQFQADTGTNTSYNQTMTTTFFRAGHAEADNETYLAYRTDSDLAQSTSAQRLGIFIGSDNDQCCSGELHLFDPSNTTFVKHFTARTSNTYYVDYHQDEFIAGYANVTAAIDGVQFSVSANTIESGTFKMYGVS